jgi:hypothetical protein
MKHWCLVVLGMAAAGLGAAPAKAPPASDAPVLARPVAREPAPAREPVPAAKEPAPPKEAAPPPVVTAGEGQRPPVGIDDLKALYKEAPLLVQFQAETVTAKPDVAPRLAWEIRGPVVEVIKGSLLPGRMFLHVDSIIRVFDMPRPDVEGKQFVAAIKPLTGGGADRRFQLVGQYAFLSESKEADALRQLAKSEAETGTEGASLLLAVKPIGNKPFAVGGPKIIEIRLTNSGSDSATYLQKPIMEKDGKLYLTGPGSLHIRDTTARLVPDKGNIVPGQMPPPPPRPAVIVPNGDWVENLDLAKYYDLPEGRYTLSLVLAAPDQRGRVVSNGFSFQVGAVNLPDATKAQVEPVRIPEPPPERPTRQAPDKTGTEAAVTEPPVPLRPAAPAVSVPDPAKYAPGKPTAGLAGLLRPAKAKYAVGDPVDLEFRLINQGPRTLAVDTRLERTLTITVQPVGDSPDPRQIDQIIAWPAGAGPMPEERAYLREGAFWGAVVNVNVLPLRPQERWAGPTVDEIAAGRNFTYERFAKSLFGFPKPGFYNVTATYSVARPHSGDPKAPAEPPKEWWIGDLQSNTITIQIGDPAK